MIAARFPFSNFELLRGEVDRLFDELFVVPGATPARAFSHGAVFPALNIWDSGDYLLAEAEIPGLTIENLDISVMGNELAIRGKREDGSGGDAVFHRQERGTGEFARTVELPYPVNTAAVEAALRNGVLTIKLPKAEAAKPRRIAVKTQ